jgi:hypothetical protein
MPTKSKTKRRYSKPAENAFARAERERSESAPGSS